jgi:hypothetical protein
MGWVFPDMILGGDCGMKIAGLKLETLPMILAEGLPGIYLGGSMVPPLY